MLYPLLRKIFFAFDPETAHVLGMNGISLFNSLGCSRLLAKPMVSCPVQVMGLTFPNPVGLAAGLDKNGEHIDGLAQLGFGHLEIGTVTPRAQYGNPKPRLFRLPRASGIINRMGFNNAGVEQLLENVRASKFPKNGGILGINIGKSASTPIEHAANDYLVCLEKVYGDASYVAVNISSPNTKNLRELQNEAALNDLLQRLKARQERLAEESGKYVPIAIKLAPDLDDQQIITLADALRRHRMDGVIATNTTLSRNGIEDLPTAAESGGLSGAPLFSRSTAVVRKLSAALANELPIIGVGGIQCGEDAIKKIDAGASLVQFYSGFIFRGPDLISEVGEALAKKLCRPR